MDLYMLTTTDNPFSPITQYDEWLVWDMARYNTNALLARVTVTSPDLSDADQEQAIQEAIDEIVKENVSGVHIKVRAGSSSFSHSVDDHAIDHAA
jgi:hypothetical protein